MMCAFARMLLRLLARVPIALLLFAGAIGARRAEAQSFRVIVHPSNPIASLTRDEVSRLFLRKVIVWKTGESVQPVDQGADSPVRASFSKAVHRKDVPAIQGYWQQLIFTGQGAPPIEKPTDDEVAAFVARTPGSIGYVSATATLGAGVRAIRIVE